MEPDEGKKPKLVRTRCHGPVMHIEGEDVTPAQPTHDVARDQKPIRTIADLNRFYQQFWSDPRNAERY
jgi:hypothetical protein